ncbi:DUF421 domain-containing protein [Tuberibacillus sp. Marseille-P3662]|uniref:DUF421 domain-containing protein n=1 Tax=Tuberibacillus sp. Marseille-P3662 TaxID=1965358 RepID=UPI000A1CDABD|nr:DUF421 domain-containing protein [Tuberibacillus sp. Marseille-P3662]
MGTILIRTLLLYILMLVAFRIMGKREIGQLNVVDLVINIMVAELAVTSIEDPSKHLIDSIIPIALLLFVQFLIAYLSMKLPAFRHIIEGQPTAIIKQGQVDEQAMRKQRYNFDDLLTQLREQGVQQLDDVDYAVLEPTGNLSVIEKSGGSLIQPTMIYPVIIDGMIQHRHLRYFNKSESWLKEQLQKEGLDDIEKIAYCAIDQKKRLHIDIKDEQE